jgi:hypothetical protein
LTFDWDLAKIPDDACREWDGELPPVRLVGNLPFSVSTRLVIDWMFDIAHRRGPWQFGRVPMALAFQDEVARRIVACPGETEWLVENCGIFDNIIPDFFGSRCWQQILLSLIIYYSFSSLVK